MSKVQVEVELSPIATQPVAVVTTNDQKAVQSKVHDLLRNGLKNVRFERAIAYARTLTAEQLHRRNFRGYRKCVPTSNDESTDECHKCCSKCPDGCHCVGWSTFTCKQCCMKSSAKRAAAHAGDGDDCMCYLVHLCGIPCFCIGFPVIWPWCWGTMCERHEGAWVSDNDDGGGKGSTTACMLVDHERGTMAWYSAPTSKNPRGTLAERAAFEQKLPDWYCV